MTVIMDMCEAPVSGWIRRDLGGLRRMPHLLKWDLARFSLEDSELDYMLTLDNTL